MPTKRQRATTTAADNVGSSPSPKRPRLSTPTPTSRPSITPLLRKRPGPDLLSALSDELLIRVLSFLSLPHLLTISPVSHRFHRLAADSQLWKALYYDRFVLPRAMRIPGFRTARSAGRIFSTGATGHKLHYSGRQQLWVDGRRGGLVARERQATDNGCPPVAGEAGEADMSHERADWKRQYKLRHNWARGKCAVEELGLGGAVGEKDLGGPKVLVKVVEGIALTADKVSGLRAWDLKTRELIAHANLDGDVQKDEESAGPSSLALDDRDLDDSLVSVSVGFLDGGFGIWRLDVRARQLDRQYRHRKSTNGELIGMAFSYPYLLTATESVLISLYTFDIPSQETGGKSPAEGETGSGRDKSSRESADNGLDTRLDDSDRAPSSGARDEEVNMFPAPYLLTSLRSHTSRPPIALSIRKTSASTIASIAYTFLTRRGWSIGLQDLHVRHTSTRLHSAPEIIATRLAYTEPAESGLPPAYASSESSPSLSSPSRRSARPASNRSPPTSSDSLSPSPPTTPSSAIPAASDGESGPTTLRYNHPYLLAALPDNTLILHLCTSTAASLDVSPGIRLWGHTSGISDAEITARGKAVSVSSRGEEMRVWELEGRGTALNGGRSVEVRPGIPMSSPPPPGHNGPASLTGGTGAGYSWDERRNWVGFDDEMVIVLRERQGGSESLMVYDFS